MSVSLDSSTIGTEQSNISSILNKIDDGLIKASIDVANTNLNKLVDTVDTMWVGVTATQFKDKVLKDKKTFISVMNTLANRMHDDISQMSENVANADAQVASHMGYSGVGGDSYSNNGSSFEYNDDYYKGYEEVSGVLSQSENDILKALNDNIYVDEHGRPYVDDGYSWNDFAYDMERTGATVATFGVSLVEGIGEFGEALADCGVLLSSAQNTGFTLAIDAGQAVYGLITGNEWESATKAMWDGTMGFVAEKHVESAFDSFYEDTAAGQTLKEYCYGFDTTRGIGSGVGYTAGVVVLSVATMGVGGAAVGAGSAGAGAGAGALATTMAGVGGAAGVGRGTETAWADGAGLGDGLAYGLANGVWEGAQFYVGGAINGLTPFASEGLNVATRIGLDSIDSGAEGIVQPALKTIYSDKSYVELFNEAGGWTNVGTQAAMGGVMSGVGEASGLAKIFRENQAKLNTTNGFLDKIGFLRNQDSGNVPIKTFDSSVEHISAADQNKLIKYINDTIRKDGECSYVVRSSKELTSTVIDSVEDSSKLKVRILGGFADENGQIKSKYLSERYMDRVTYTGAEASNFLKQIEHLESRIDKSLPLTERAKQAYDVLAAAIPVMSDYADYAGGHEVAASLRGLTDYNVTGKQGLVCAGYAQAYKELCDRIGIECDYVRGQAISPIERGNHAWNVIKGTNGEIIPVDVTWRASTGEDKWFGGGEAFAKSHIADVGEKYTNYSQPLAYDMSARNAAKLSASYGNSSNLKLDHVSSTLTSKYGSAEATQRLLRYAATENQNLITRTDNARDLVATVPVDDIKLYLSYKNRTEVVNSGLNYVKDVMINKYGEQMGNDQFFAYLQSGNINAVTRDNDARAVAGFFTKEDLHNYMVSH